MGKGGHGRGKSGKLLRFSRGAHVECQTDEGWQSGQVVDLWYTEPGFPKGFHAPYQVELDDGGLIYVPKDIPELCREGKDAPPQTDRVSDASTADRASTWWEKAFRLGGGSTPPSGEQCPGRRHLRRLPRERGAPQRISHHPQQGQGAAGAPMASKVRAAATSAGVDLDEEDPSGSTALSESVRRGWDTVARVLLDLGADPDAVDGEGRGPLHLAVTASCAQPEQVSSMVKALLEARADPNAQDRDPERDPRATSLTFMERKKHRTPLHYCAARDFVAAARHLLDAAADPNTIDGQYKTPLHLAIDEGSSRATVSALLAAGADPDKGNIEIGLTSSCLMVAARSGDARLAAALIGAKADVNLAGKHGMTPLHLAARSRKAEVAQLLVVSGCDVDLQAMGMTAAQLALTNGDRGLADLLGEDPLGCGGDRRSGDDAPARLDEKRRRELFLE